MHLYCQVLLPKEWWNAQSLVWYLGMLGSSLLLATIDGSGIIVWMAKITL